VTATVPLFLSAVINRRHKGYQQPPN